MLGRLQSWFVRWNDPAAADVVCQLMQQVRSRKMESCVAPSSTIRLSPEWVTSLLFFACGLVLTYFSSLIFINRVGVFALVGPVEPEVEAKPSAW